MELWAFSAMLLLVAIVIGAVIGLLIVSRGNKAEAEEQQGYGAYAAGQWQIQLWDVGLGTCAQSFFYGGIILGRGPTGMVRQGILGVGQDVTISREHCLIFDQDGMSCVCNLSEVNPTLVNGVVVKEIEPIGPGDRLSLGKHMYLITALDR